MIVMKFGGTALQNPASINKVISAINASLNQNPIVVLSAFGKSTRMLEELFKLCRKGDLEAAYSLIDTDFLPLSLSLFESELSPEYESECLDDLNKRIKRLKNFISSHERKWDSGDRDYIVAQGELITSRIIYYILNNEGIDCNWLDAREMIISDEIHWFAQPDFKSSAELVKQKVESSQKENKLAITQGFIASTPSGLTTTLGYEGSDLSATFLAACIGAERVELYKTVSGIMTADPNLVPEAKTVNRISYENIEKLTFLRSKILHKNAIQPLIELDIPLRILNLHKPKDNGTTIENTDIDDLENHFFVVGHPNGVLISKHHSNGNDLTESDRIGLILSKRDIANVPIENSMEHIQYFLRDKFSLKAASRQLSGIDNLSWTEDVAMIGMIHNSLSEKDLIKMISNTIEEYGAKVLASYSSSEMNIIVIPADKFNQVCKALHSVLNEYSAVDAQLMERK